MVFSFAIIIVILNFALCFRSSFSLSYTQQVMGVLRSTVFSAENHNNDKNLLYFRARATD